MYTRGSNTFGSTRKSLSDRYHSSRPYVFLSHASVDKEKVRKIAQFLMDRGVDIYFDEQDQCLLSAISAHSDEAIVQCIHDGLEHSTHALCVLSRSTLESQWVPYEIGYSRRKGHPLALLQLAEVEDLPAFYRVAHVIPDISDLEKYVGQLLKGQETYLVEGVHKALTENRHPLSAIMKPYRYARFR